MKRPTIQELLKRDKVLKLEIGYAGSKEAGFICMDGKDVADVDVHHSVEDYPWPFPDNTFTLLSAPHVVHKINRDYDGFLYFMDECWRVLKYEGQMRIATPYGVSTGFLSDPCAVNPCTPQTFMYFDPLHPTQLYKRYRPRPWKLEQVYWQTDGLLEVLLSKRREDPSYKK